MVDIESKEFSTEEKIMDAAIKVFTEKGLAGARMQEIADEAGVNKAMVHYYYRSKQNLFETIFRKKVKELFGAFSIILSANKSFENKIRSFIETEIEIISQFPSLPLFVLNEAGKNPAILEEVFEEGGPKQMIQLFQNIVEQEVNQGHIRPIKFEELLINIMSMCIYPFIARPILQFLLDKDDLNYKSMIETRKRTVADLIINDLFIKRDQ
ncbi:MAG: TetR/AcrR family transcriptional regulator [Saprospiraceae bacterium]|nr:TetR/AcrR family transcriptional regulator [Saprospiraceae bacterium]